MLAKIIRTKAALVYSLISSIAFAGRTVFLNSPAIGANVYTETFFYRIPDGDADTTKLSSVTVCTNDYYGVILASSISMTWSSGSTFTQEAIDYQSATATCTTRAVTGEVGTIAIMLAGSD